MEKDGSKMNYLEQWRVLIAASIGLSLVLIAIVLMLSGCTTMSHEPECVCDCNATSSHFECGGVHYYKNTDIK